MKRRTFLVGVGCTWISRPLWAKAPGGVDFAQGAKMALVPHDHTTVMQFLFENLSELEPWLRKRRPGADISQADALEALKHLQSLRPGGDRNKQVIDVCIQMHPVLTEKRRSIDRAVQSDLTSLEQNLKAAKNLEDLGALLAKERGRVRSKKVPSLDTSLDVAQAIYDDAMKHQLYTSFRAVKTGRGKWIPSMKDVAEIAAQDLLGAAAGAAMGAAAGAAVGGVVGGIAASGQTVVSKYYNH
ncbi:MAG TPA: hypothetical protein PK777_13925 [Thermoguttaceae bacterium]|nr:hypothetical protein [Thermoguttaceae bacterium]HPP54045.1 hypothetical protein [Thermoguttaceae bacterium]